MLSKVKNLLQEKEKQVKMFVLTKEFWDVFLTKLISFVISVKIWSIIFISYLFVQAIKLFTELLVIGKLDPSNYSSVVSSMFSSFATVFTGIIALRGALEFADIYKSIKESIKGKQLPPLEGKE